MTRRLARSRRSAIVITLMAVASVGCSSVKNNYDVPQRSTNTTPATELSIPPTTPETTPIDTPATQGPTTSANEPAATGLDAPPTSVVTRTAVPSSPDTASGTVIASNLDVPWGIDFFPDGDALVAERDTAQLLQISPGGAVTELATVAGVTPTAEGGLLGVAISPDYATDQLVYVYSTTADDNRVRRGTIDDFRDGQDHVILNGIPSGAIHNGGRLAFGPDGMLYVSTGEAGDPELSQNMDSLGGKILRIKPDGSIPDDNPFVGSPIWSFGHRNVQGLAWDDAGRMWASEFGASTWDEVNRILPGHNYGWPETEGTGTIDGLTDPAAVFSTSSASPSGLAYANGHLWMGALQGATLWRIQVTENGELTDPTAIRVLPARTRSVALAPDGQLWITTSNTDGRGQPDADQDKIIAIDP